MSHRITEAYLFVIIDPKSGDESIPAMTKIDPSGNSFTIPLLGTDHARVESLMATAQQIANALDQTIEIIRLTQREKIGEVNPER